MNIQEKYHEYLRDVRTTTEDMFYDDLFHMTFAVFSKAITEDIFQELVPISVFEACLKVQMHRRMFPDRYGRW